MSSPLDLDASRPPVTPKDAATLILLRAEGDGMEVFCVERNRSLKFMGGNIVFPGGKLDDANDRSPDWEALSTSPDPRGLGFAADMATLRALAIAACRESLEEAAILPVKGGTLTADELLAIRTLPMRASLAERKLKVDLAALHPFARWVTPTAESRRYDARFFLAVAPEGQPGAHDESETMASFWARPSRVLERFDAGEVQLAPPTHRTLEILANAHTIAKAIEIAAKASLEPVCPKLVQHEDEKGQTLALVLPGDRDHEVREVRVPGRSRFVMRGDRFRPE
jgi:8-oxo-dGTP pyrophosphatase MutT (NUDIX family)